MPGTIQFDVAFLVNLQGAQNSSVNVTAADKTEGDGMLNNGAAIDCGGGLATGVYHIGVGIVPGGSLAGADDAYLGLKPNLDTFGKIVNTLNGKTDAQIDKVAVLEEFCTAGSYESTTG